MNTTGVIIRLAENSQAALHGGNTSICAGLEV